MLPDRVSNPGPLTYESGALLIVLRGQAYTHGYNNTLCRETTSQVLWHLEIPRVWNNTTEKPEQKKTTSWTPNDQATDKTLSSPNQLKYINKLHVGPITEPDARPTGVQLKREAKL